MPDPAVFDAGRMRFDDDSVTAGAIPRPVNLVGRNSLKVAFLALKAFVLNEEPNFSFLDEVDLLRLVNVGSRVVTGRARGDHQAAFVAVTLARDHRALPLPSPPVRTALLSGTSLLFQR